MGLKIAEAYLYETVDTIVPCEGRLSIIDYGGGDYMIAFSNVFLGCASIDTSSDQEYTHFDNYAVETKYTVLSELRCVRYWI